MEIPMPGPDALCIVILFVTMTIGFAIGSLLVRLGFYSSIHGFDDNNIELMDDLKEFHNRPSTANWDTALQHAGNEFRTCNAASFQRSGKLNRRELNSRRVQVGPIDN
jgi:hypothetical protein